MKRSTVVEVRPVDDQHQVLSVETTGGGPVRHRRTPCGGCPWRVDQTGAFPAAAFEESARTAYDMSTHMFGCHESGSQRSSTCAGFLLRGADDNLAVRMKTARGLLDPRSVDDGGHELHDSYRAMALANGVAPDAEALRRCAR